MKAVHVLDVVPGLDSSHQHQQQREQLAGLELEEDERGGAGQELQEAAATFVAKGTSMLAFAGRMQ